MGLGNPGCLEIESDTLFVDWLVIATRARHHLGMPLIKNNANLFYDTLFNDDSE
jgi:hypothetical protein